MPYGICSSEHIAVNLDKLRRFSGWSAKIAKAQQQLAEELAAELAQAESVHDPLAVHIYQARADFRRTCDLDKSKHGRHIESTIRSSYREAEQLGFRAPYEFWALLMRCGTADTLPASTPTPSPAQNGSASPS